MPLGNVVKALYQYTAAADDELSFEEDDLMCVTEPENSNDEWWFARLIKHQDRSGLVPKNYVEPLECICTMIASYAYEAVEENELGFVEGQQVFILNKLDDDWWLAKNEAGLFGLVPANYLSENAPSTDQNAPTAVIAENNVFATATGAADVDTGNLSRAANAPVQYRHMWAAVTYDQAKKKQKGHFGISSEDKIVFIADKTKDVIFRHDMADIGKFDRKAKKLFMRNSKQTIPIDMAKQDAKDFEKIFNETAPILPGRVVIVNQTEANADSASDPEENDAISENSLAFGFQDGDDVLSAKSVEKSPNLNDSSAAIMRADDKPPPSDFREPKEHHYAVIDKIVALYDYDPQHKDELKITEGESLELLERTDENWWLVRRPGQPDCKGIVPKDYLQAESEAAQSRPINIAAAAVAIGGSAKAEEPPAASSKQPAFLSELLNRTEKKMQSLDIAAEKRAVSVANVQSAPSKGDRPAASTIAEREASITRLPALDAKEVPTAAGLPPVLAAKQQPAVVYEYTASTTSSSLPAKTSLSPPEIVKATPRPAAPGLQLPAVNLKKTEHKETTGSGVKPTSSGPPSPIIGPNLLRPTFGGAAAAAKGASTLGSVLSKGDVPKSPAAAMAPVIKSTPPLRTHASTSSTAAEQPVSPVKVPPPKPVTNNPWSSLSLRKSSFGDASSSNSPALTKASLPASTASSSQPKNEELAKKTLPSRPDLGISGDKPKPSNTRLWTDKSGKFQVEAEFCSFSNGSVQLHKLNGNRIDVSIDVLCDRDVEYVYRKEGIPWTHVPSQSFAVGGFNWMAFFTSAGISLDRATKYAQTFVEHNLDESVFMSMTRELLKEKGLLEGDILQVLQAATKKKAEVLERAAAKKNLDKVREYISPSATTATTTATATKSSSSLSAAATNRLSSIGNSSLSGRNISDIPVLAPIPKVPIMKQPSAQPAGIAALTDSARSTTPSSLSAADAAQAAAIQRFNETFKALSAASATSDSLNGSVNRLSVSSTAGPMPAASGAMTASVTGNLHNPAYMSSTTTMPMPGNYSQQSQVVDNAAANRGMQQQQGVVVPLQQQQQQGYHQGQPAQQQPAGDFAPIDPVLAQIASQFNTQAGKVLVSRSTSVYRSNSGGEGVTTAPAAMPIVPNASGYAPQMQTGQPAMPIQGGGMMMNAAADGGGNFNGSQYGMPSGGGGNFYNTRNSQGPMGGADFHSGNAMGNQGQMMNYASQPMNQNFNNQGGSNYGYNNDSGNRNSMPSGFNPNLGGFNGNNNMAPPPMNNQQMGSGGMNNSSMMMHNNNGGNGAYQAYNGNMYPGGGNMPAGGSFNQGNNDAQMMMRGGSNNAPMGMNQQHQMGNQQNYGGGPGGMPYNAGGMQPPYGNPPMGGGNFMNNNNGNNSGNYNGGNNNAYQSNPYNNFNNGGYYNQGNYR